MSSGGPNLENLNDLLKIKMGRIYELRSKSFNLPVRHVDNTAGADVNIKEQGLGGSINTRIISYRTW